MLVIDNECSIGEHTFVSSEGIVEIDRSFDSDEGEKQTLVCGYAIQFFNLLSAAC